MNGRRDEAGFATTIWMVMVAGMMLTLVLLALDVWKLVAVDRQLSGAVDSAAAAGANAVDEAQWRTSATLALDPSRAEALAEESLNAQPGADTLTGVVIDATTERVSVTAQKSVRLLLLSVIGNSGRTVYAAAEATPRRRTP